MKTFTALCDLTHRRIIRTGVLVMVYLALIGCAQFTHRMPEQLPFMDRSQTKTDGEVRVTVAVPQCRGKQADIRVSAGGQKHAAGVAGSRK